MQDTKPAKYEGRAQTLTTNTTRVGELVARAAVDMANARDTEERVRISLTDVDQVRECAVGYLKECADSGILPTVRGVAGKLGVTRQALYEFSWNHPGSQFARWLEDFSDMCGELTMAAALDGSVNVVAAIFTTKARNGWKDNITIDIPVNDPLGKRQTMDAIAAKYKDLDAAEFMLPD